MVIDLSGSLSFRAARFAAAAHKEQKRKYTGEPYIKHPASVARMARELDLSEEAVAAAWLHDVVEDCGVKLMEIQTRFGERVAFLVMALSDLQTSADGNRATRKQKYREKIHNIRDEEAHTLKLLDLTDNAPSIREHDEKFWALYRIEARGLMTVLDLGLEGARDLLRMILAEEDTRG